MFDAIKAKRKTKRARKKKNKIIMLYIETGIKRACKQGEYYVVLDKEFKIPYYDYTCYDYYNVDELDGEYMKVLLQKGYTIASIDYERKIKISWKN